MRLCVSVVVLALITPASAQQTPGPFQPSPPAPARDAAPPAGKGIIRGVVTALDTGKPIRNATIVVQSQYEIPTLDMFSVFTDAQGRYEFSGLKPGQYGLSARKAGYLSLSYGQTRVNGSSRLVTLSESTPLDKIDFALPLAGVIVARITDQFGDPVRGVMVRPFVQRFAEGRRQLSSLGLSGAGAVTDDRGETRIYGLAPGDYYVAAMADFGVMWRGDVETLFPGTLDVASAQTVRVGAGQEVFATFPIQRARPGSLSGRIVNSDGGPPSSPSVFLEQVQLSGGGSSRPINLTPDGSFREENLPPGNWMIVAKEPEYGSARVQLLGDAVQGITVTTRKAAAVRGRVKFEGAAPPANPVALYVTFDGPRTFVSGAGFVRSAEGLGAIRATPEEQWAFEAQISGVGAIRARVPGWILKAVLLDGKDVTDTPLDFGAAYSGKPVEVVLTQRRGEVSGVVQNDRGQLTSDYQVVLFPEDEMQWTPFSRAFAVGGPDQQGRFTIQNLPPARYFAAAVASLAPGDERNPEVLSRLRGGATSFELSEGESRTVSLRLTR
jgi:carboxypeptidase family protein